MKSAQELLASYETRREALREFYFCLRDEFKSQVSQLRDANQLQIASNARSVDHNFQFFELESPNSTHLRIVSAMGTIVASLDDLQLNCGCIVHLHNDGELRDLSATYTFVEEDQRLVSICVSKGGERETLPVTEEVRQRITELLFPTVTSDRYQDSQVRQS